MVAQETTTDKCAPRVAEEKVVEIGILFVGRTADSLLRKALHQRLLVAKKADVEKSSAEATLLNNTYVHITRDKEVNGIQ